MFLKTYLRKIYTPFVKKRKLQKIKSGGQISLDQLTIDLVNFGIKKGDILFVHSSLSRLGFVEGGAETVIDALKESVGTKGTLLFPTFSFAGGGVYKTISNPAYVFDANSEPSYVGKISEVFRTQKGILRSLHPTHSVAAWGKLASHFTEHHAELGSNWGKGTPFGKMLDLNIKMISIGVKLPKYTFFHCVEDYNLDLFPDLYAKDKLAIKIKKDNKILTFEIPYHDPNFLTDRIELNPSIAKYFTDHFMASGKLEVGKIGNAETLLIKCRDFYDLTVELAKIDKTIYKV